MCFYRGMSLIFGIICVLWDPQAWSPHLSSSCLPAFVESAADWLLSRLTVDVNVQHFYLQPLSEGLYFSSFHNVLGSFLLQLQQQKIVFTFHKKRNVSIQAEARTPRAGLCGAAPVHACLQMCRETRSL